MSSQPRKRRGLSTWLLSTATPLFVVSRLLRVVFFNTGCEQLTGWTAADVIGRVCEFVSEPDHRQVECLTGALCPPPAAFEGAEATVPTQIVTREGARVDRLIRFVPLLGADQQVERVLGILSASPPSPPAATEPLGHLRHAELAALRREFHERYGVDTVVGWSVRLQRLLEQVDVARRHPGSIHFQGEPGTGKEHLARVIHAHSELRDRAFVPLDLSRLSRSEASDVVSRLLRDIRSPDATDLSPGTVFLKDVECSPESLQQQLVAHLGGTVRARFWEAGAAGTGRSHPADAPPPLRLMSSSTVPLHEAVRDDRLSDEFVQLLGVQRIDVPPLRDRLEDVPYLAQYFLEELNRHCEEQVAELADDVQAALQRYSWPGNIDELRAVIAEARRLCSRPTITLKDLPFRFRTGRDARSLPPPPPAALVSLERALAEAEREFIQRALEQAGHNKAHAARLLGITRPRLYRRMQTLGLADGEGDPAG